MLLGFVSLVVLAAAFAFVLGAGGLLLLGDFVVRGLCFLRGLGGFFGRLLGFLLGFGLAEGMI